MSTTSQSVLAVLSYVTVRVYRTEDDVMYADALQLAADFKMNDWPVHFSSLENAITS